jgi:uncharacterized protein YdhG (YjbR/CyaY superfamily)
MPMNAIDEYIRGFSGETRKKLEEIREIIRSTVPEAEEVISYGMPAYKMKKVLVYFAGYNNHIGFYPTGSGIRKFSHEFGSYKWSKGAVQFPLNGPLPKDLIIRITLFRKEEVTLPKS